jgi:hypothetical protein
MALVRYRLCINLCRIYEFLHKVQVDQRVKEDINGNRLL